MTFPAYPAYKDSGVEWLGEVPEHWGILTAKRLFGNVRESAKPDAEQLAATQAYGVIPQKDFMEKNDVKVVLALSGTESFRGVRANDFVISLRSFQGGIEHSAYDGCVSPAYTVLRRRDEKKLNPGYFRYLLKDFSYISALQSVTTGIREGRTITYDQFGSLPLPVAPVAEQTQIARFLDHETARIDALIEEQQRLIELLKEKRQAVISHAVTKGLDPTVPMKDSGVEWLGEVPAHWDVRKFYFGIKAIIDNRGRSPSYIDSGIPILEARQLSDETMECSSDFSKYISEESHSEFVRDDVAPGDVLMVTVGTIGKVGVVGENPDYVILQNIVGFRVDDDIESGFMGIYLKSGAAFMAMQATNKESILSSVKVSDFIQHKMPLPPLAEQKAIVRSVNASLSKYGVLQKEAELLCSNLHERRSALISAAVTGKIDVRGWQPPVCAQAPESVQEAV